MNSSSKKINVKEKIKKVPYLMNINQPIVTQEIRDLFDEIKSEYKSLDDNTIQILFVDEKQ